MLSRFKPKSEFNRNVLALMTGTTIAQAVTIAVMPILTRIYTPSEFGIFALYSSIVTILSVLASGRYELAIMQAEKLEDADLLMVGVFLLSLMSALLMLIFLLFSYKWLNSILLRQTGLEAYWLYLIPLSVFLTSVYQALQYWLNKRKEYKSMSANKVLLASSTACSNIFFGVVFATLSNGLIFGYLVGNLISVLPIVKKNYPHIKNTKIKNVLPLLSKYSNYPMRDMPAGIMNTAAQQGPNLLMVPLFGSVAGGHFFLVQRLLMMPITLLSASVASVFRQEATDCYHKNGRFDDVFLGTLVKLVALSMPLMIVVILFADDIFDFVFGSEWRIAGEYAKVLIVVFVLKFIVSPLTFSFYVKDRLGLNLIGQFAYLFATTITLSIGYYFNNFSLFVYSFTASGSIIYLGYLLVSWRLSK